MVKVHVDYGVKQDWLRFVSTICKMSVLNLMPLSIPHLEIAVFQIRSFLVAVSVVHVAPQIYVRGYVHQCHLHKHNMHTKGEGVLRAVLRLCLRYNCVSFILSRAFYIIGRT